MNGRRKIDAPLLLPGMLLIAAGLGIYLFGALLALPGRLLLPSPTFVAITQRILWRSSIPVFVGMLMAAADLAILVRFKRRRHGVRFDIPATTEVTVVLTVYIDQASIGDAVDDFRLHPCVKRVIVVDNSSADGTAEVARRHGAVVVTEPVPGYGRCVHRALHAGVACETPS